jgi:actin
MRRLSFGRSVLFCSALIVTLPGLVIEAGETIAHTVPVYEGHSIPHAVQTSIIAGRELTDRLVKLLTASGYPLTSTAEREIVRDIKVAIGHRNVVACRCSDPAPLCQEKQCFVSEVRGASQHHDKSYELPDGQVITLGKVRRRDVWSWFSHCAASGTVPLPRASFH